MFEVKNKTIIDKNSCDILGEHLEYDMEDEYDIKSICEILNTLSESQIALAEIMRIIHGIKYGNLEYQALDDYIYKGIDINDIFEDDLKV